MSSDVIQFQCAACHSTLTVPAHLAGVSGPCPHCGQTVTSPQASAPTAPPPQMIAPPVQPPAPAWMPQPAPPAQPAPPPWATPAAQAGSHPGSGPVMPLPNVFPKPSTGMGGPPNTPSYINPAPHQEPAPAAQLPPWQQAQPGLGNTLLGGAQQSPPTANPLGNSILPPKRQGPPSSFLPGGPPAQPQAAWGSQTSEPQGPPAFGQSSGSSHNSQLIPGAPPLPNMGSAASGEGFGSLLGKNTAPSAMNSPMAGGEGGSKQPPIPSLANAGSRPPVQRRNMGRKPKRSSNLFMFCLAVIFIFGFLAAAGWLLRDQVMILVHRYAPELAGGEPAPLEIQIPTVPQGEFKPLANTPPSPTPEKLPARSAESAPLSETIAETPPPKTPGFDPLEAAPPKAMAVSPEEVSAAIGKPLPSAQDGFALPDSQKLGATASTALNPPGLVEVPPKSVLSSLNNNSAPATSEVLSGTLGPKIETTAEGRPAAEALRNFLMATSLEERIKYTLAAEQMRPLMERYYAHNPAGPIQVDQVGLVRVDPDPQVGEGAHAVFGVESKTWEFPVPVMLEETKSGFKVDWLSFVEFKDRMLEKFFQGYQEGPARFHVNLSRYHHFDDSVPNADSKDAFQVGPAPPNPYKASVFLDKETGIGRDLRDKLPWGAQLWAIVELQWVKLGTAQWVELVAVPQMNWYSVPAIPKASAADGASKPEGKSPKGIKISPPGTSGEVRPGAEVRKPGIKIGPRDQAQPMGR